MRHVLEPF
nr:Chain C, Pol MF8 peptide from Pol protein [Simian immunodeficiency virus]3RWH_F Chain F, Pol MF8 peptide from Pol protein [Simian immunodeficiency virus]